jgi:hypothetical protein
MAPDEYNKALDKAVADLENRVQQRELLSADIAGLKETVRVLSNIAQTTAEKRQQIAQLLAMVDYATPSLTDAVRALLTKNYPKEMTAVEVRNALEDSSNSEEFNNSLSACHAALKRIVSEGQAELGPTRGGKATYRRVLKLESPRMNSFVDLLLGGHKMTNPPEPPAGLIPKTLGQRTVPPPPGSDTTDKWRAATGAPKKK